MHLKYPQWQNPLAEALLEFDPAKLNHKVQKAEEAIRVRVHELVLAKDCQAELRALADGQSLIRGVKQDRLGLLDQESPSPF